MPGPHERGVVAAARFEAVVRALGDALQKQLRGVKRFPVDYAFVAEFECL